MKKKVAIQGYSPDVDPTTPGVLTDCTAFVPSMKGMKGAPTPVTTSLPALATACAGAAVVRKLDNSTRLFAGTRTKMFEAGTTSYTDRTRVASDYTLATDGRWRFAQFGDVSLAATKTDVTQFSTTGVFADITGAPKASIIEVVNQFVFLLDTNEGTFGDSPSRWICSAIGDYTDWVYSITTQCTSGLLTSAPGKIRAAKKFGDALVVYKDRAMYLGIYIGAPTVWSFTQIPGEFGTPSNETVINVGTPENPRHIFMGFEDFYTYDGSSPKPIGSPSIKETVFNELAKPYAYVSMALHDQVNSRIYFFYPFASTVFPDRCVVYNYRTGKWGRDNRTVEAVTEFIASGVTYDGLGALYSTYTDLPDVSYDSSFLSGGFPTPAIFNTSHVIQTLTGASQACSMTTGDFGDDSQFSTLQRLRPRFIQSPTTGTMTNYFKDNAGNALQLGNVIPWSSGKFDILKSARWHRAVLEFTGPVEVAGWEVELETDGDE